MKYSFEVPIRYSEAFDDVQDYLFVLGQNLRDIDYYEYVRRSDKYKILDNGANEEDYVAPYLLIDLAKGIHADMIVIPDKQFQMSRSIAMFNKFYNLAKKLVPEIKLMGVPQGGSRNAHHKMVRMMTNVVDVIGIPYKLILRFGYGIIPYVNQPLHMLGFPNKDLGQYMVNRNFETIDTGAPFNAALKGFKLEDIIKPVRGVNIGDPNLRVTTEIEELFRHNVQTLKRMVEVPILTQ
jgi:hypothetical protein